MKKSIILLAVIITAKIVAAQSPTGKWKMLSHISSYDGQTFDSHKALLTQRPCAAKIIYEFNADGTYRLDASQSGCDESYKKIQEKLWSKSTWKVNGNTLFIGGKEGIGHTYTVTFSSNKMICKGTDGDGTITYQKL